MKVKFLYLTLIGMMSLPINTMLRRSKYPSTMTKANFFIPPIQASLNISANRYFSGTKEQAESFLGLTESAKQYWEKERVLLEEQKNGSNFNRFKEDSLRNINKILQDLPLYYLHSSLHELDLSSPDALDKIKMLYQAYYTVKNQQISDNELDNDVRKSFAQQVIFNILSNSNSSAELLQTIIARKIPLLDWIVEFGIVEEEASTSMTQSTNLSLSRLRVFLGKAYQVLGKEEFKIFLNMANQNGETALIKAVKENKKQAFLDLIYFCPNLNIVDNQGKNVVDYSLEQLPTLMPGYIEKRNVRGSLIFNYFEFLIKMENDFADHKFVESYLSAEKVGYYIDQYVKKLSNEFITGDSVDDAFLYGYVVWNFLQLHKTPSFVAYDSILKIDKMLHDKSSKLYSWLEVKKGDPTLRDLLGVCRKRLVSSLSLEDRKKLEAPIIEVEEKQKVVKNRENVEESKQKSQEVDNSSYKDKAAELASWAQQYSIQRMTEMKEGITNFAQHKFEELKKRRARDKASIEAEGKLREKVEAQNLGQPWDE